MDAVAELVEKDLWLEKRLFVAWIQALYGQIWNLATASVWWIISKITHHLS